MQNPRYLARSWSLLTKSKGWIKPVLVLTAAQYVPIVGGMGVDGYALEWARLTAWGVDAEPKHRGVDIPGCIISGFRALLVSLGISIVVGIATGALSVVASVPGGSVGDFLSFIVGVVSLVVTLLASMVIMIAQLRSAIYERISAGFSISTIYQMIRRDINGFLRLLGISLLFSFLVFVIAFALGVIIALILMPAIMMTMSGYQGDVIMRALAATAVPIALVSVPFSFLLSFVNVVYTLVEYNAIGLWMRQFNVPAWGGPDEPLPEETPSVGSL